MNVRRRTLPVSHAHREFTVRVNGEVVPRSQHLLSVSVSSPVNKIASARLVYQDGAASRGAFPLLDQNLFAHGSEVEILAGTSDESVTIFKGLVVALKTKLSESCSSKLIITCKHNAIKSTLTLNGRYFEEMSDSDIIRHLLRAYGLNSDIHNTEETHHQTVQYDCSDWDFCLQRARANGLLLFTREDELSCVPPDLSSDPVCNLEYGATLLSADLETDARIQRSEFTSLFWSSSDQELTQQNGQSDTPSTPGNTTSANLAESIGSPVGLLRQNTNATGESQKWADANRQRAELNRVCGTIKTHGIATVKPGDMVALSGLGDAFNGNALVTGVRHEHDLVSGWRSYFQVGGIDDSLQQNAQQPAQMSGLQIARVIDNEDPTGEFRVKICLPMLDNQSEGIWARVASIDAGDDRGVFIRPEPDDEVVVGFVLDDPRSPLILGMLHSSANPAPESPTNDNDIKVFKTRSGIEIKLDDKNCELILTTSNENKLSLNDSQQGVTLSDENGNRLILNSDGIQIESASNINLTASGAIKLEASSDVEIAAGASLKAEGSGGVDVSSSAITNITGSLIKLN